MSTQEVYAALRTCRGDIDELVVRIKHLEACFYALAGAFMGFIVAAAVWLWPR